MEHELPLDPTARADDPRQDDERDDGTHEVTPDVAYKRQAIVNVAYVGRPGAERGWVLIDAGLPGTAGQIVDAAEKRFGSGARPAAIVMTHGHFDHFGALEELAERWQVPVYAHPLEIPYLNGTACYPPPDPTVGGGLMSLLSPLYPRHPVDVSRWLQPLPGSGAIPPLPGWRWLPSPGHTPGHVSFWRENDRTLIVGDAFITTMQESAYSAMTQEPEMHGPPAYFTQDWKAAHASVIRLATLNPEIVVCGHGRAMHGPQMRQALHRLANDFESIAIPTHGRYVTAPTHPENGTAYPAA